MDKKLLLLGLAAAAAAGCGVLHLAPGVQGDGDIQTIRAEAEPFNELVVGRAFVVRLTQGKTDGVEIHADKNLHPLIQVRNEGSVLRIDAKENLKPTKPIEIEVSAETLRKIHASGATKVTASGFDEPVSIRLEASGASRVVYEGPIKDLTADASGASAIVARRLVDAKAEAKASGSSGIELAGTATEGTFSASGASGVNAENLKADTVRAEASGASHCTVDARKHLDANANGASKVAYVGDPEKLDKKVSGASRVERR